MTRISIDRNRCGSRDVCRVAAHGHSRGRHARVSGFIGFLNEIGTAYIP